MSLASDVDSGVESLGESDIQEKGDAPDEEARGVAIQDEVADEDAVDEVVEEVNRATRGIHTVLCLAAVGLVWCGHSCRYMKLSQAWYLESHPASKAS